MNKFEPEMSTYMDIFDKDGNCIGYIILDENFEEHDVVLEITE